MKPSGRPSIRASAVTISGAKRSRRKVTEPSSASVSTIGRDLIGAARPLRDGSRSAAWSGTRPAPSSPGSSRAAAWRPRSPPLRRRRPRRPRRCRPASPSARPRRGRPPSPPPSIIAGPPIPSEAFSVATIRSEQPARTALPAKQRPATIAIRGTRPESRPRARRRACRVRRRPDSRCRRGDRRRPRRRARSAAASARSARRAGPSCGGRAHPASRPAPCSRRRGPRSGALAEEIAVDPRGAADRARRRACGRSARRPRAARAGRRSRSGRTRQAAGVDQVGDVLPRRPGTRAVAPLDRLGPAPRLRSVPAARSSSARSARSSAPPASGPSLAAGQPSSSCAASFFKLLLWARVMKAWATEGAIRSERGDFQPFELELDPRPARRSASAKL